jgi:hypothetical protein
MDLRAYVSCWVKIDTVNGFYYEGKVLSADESSLELLDRNGRKVSLTKPMIVLIREVARK